MSINFIYVRKINYLSQEDFSEQLGVKKHVVAKIEAETNKYFDLALLQKVGNEYNINLDDLINKDLEQLDKETSKNYDSKDELRQAQDVQAEYLLDQKTIKLYEELTQTNNKVVATYKEIIVEKDKRIALLEKEVERERVLNNQADTLGKLLLSYKAQLEIEKAEEELKNGKIKEKTS